MVPPVTEWIAYLLVSPLVISLGLLWQAPDLAWYRGFVALKLAYENALYTPELENPFIGGRVIRQAHWLGALTGAVAGLLSILAEKRFRKPVRSSQG